MAEMASVGGFASSNWAVGCQCEVRRMIEIAYVRTDMSEESKEREGLYMNLYREYSRSTKFPSGFSTNPSPTQQVFLLRYRGTCLGGYQRTWNDQLLHRDSVYGR